MLWFLLTMCNNRLRLFFFIFFYTFNFTWFFSIDFIVLNLVDKVRIIFFRLRFLSLCLSMSFFFFLIFLYNILGWPRIIFNRFVSEIVCTYLIDLLKGFSKYLWYLVDGFDLLTHLLFTKLKLINIIICISIRKINKLA